MARTRKAKAVVIAADLSMRRPAFAIICLDGKCDLTVAATYVIDNTSAKDKAKTHPEMLVEISDKITTEILPSAKRLCRTGALPGTARERGFSKHAAATQALYKVVGVSDLVLKRDLGSEWDDIAPTTVKKEITGKGTATKAEVAQLLDEYFDSKVSDLSEDETDAIAVGVTWMIQNGYIDSRLPKPSEYEASDDSKAKKQRKPSNKKEENECLPKKMASLSTGLRYRIMMRSSSSCPSRRGSRAR